MIVVDSSALIEFYRPSGDPRVRDAVAAAIADDQVAVNGIIRVEILAFAAGEAERRLLAADFEAFHHLDLGLPDFDLACQLGFTLRRRGVTVPATDLIIAASALRTGAPLLHVDAHFDRIAEVSDLVVVERRTES
jgi:predicted nucleic acid-binding protein